MCPAKQKFGEFFPIFAYKFLICGVPFSLNSIISHLKPNFLRFFATTLIAPSSFGVTLWHLTRSLAKKTSLIVFSILIS